MLRFGVRAVRLGCVGFGAAFSLSLPMPARAQATASVPGTVADTADKTGTNPANLQTSVDLFNRFASVDDQLFVDQVTWRYAQAFAGHRMRARVDLPLTFGNLTGRVEAGFGDVAPGWEWLAAARGRVGVLAGVDLTFDTSSNDALAVGHHTAAPAIGVVVVPRSDTVISLRYDQRLSLNTVDGRADVNKGTLEGSVVRRGSDDWWVRATASLNVDVEQSTTWSRLRGEWGKVLFGGFSTWVQAGGGLGASRPADWTVDFGFRVVR